MDATVLRPLRGPSGVGWEFLNQRTGGVAALNLRLLSGKPSACTSPRSVPSVFRFINFGESSRNWHENGSNESDARHLCQELAAMV
jgi:hypothetical protein